MSKNVSSANKGQLTSGHKKKNKTEKSRTSENKKKKDKNLSGKDSEAVTGSNSKKVQNYVEDSVAKKKNNSAGRKSDRKITTNRSTTGTKDEIMTSHILRENLGTVTVSETLPTVAAVGDEEDPLDYNLEAILAEGEEDLLWEVQSEDISVIDGPRIASEKELDSDGDLEVEFLNDVDSDVLETRTEALGDDVTVVDDLYSVPKKYREGTAGGKLFEEQTLAEIDGYLYLGKVS